MNAEGIQKVLAAHKRWLTSGGEEGERADLGGADLRGAGLRVADLRGADLRGADLRGSDMRDASLGGADLSGAVMLLGWSLENKEEK